METPARTVVPVILSGGNGTRLWPMSRELYPKQLLALQGEASLLQQTASRVSGADFVAPVVLCGEAHRFVVAEQLSALGTEPRALVLEPVLRSTAPALAVAAQLIVRDDPDALMLVCPSDHCISDQAAYLSAVRTAVAVAAEGHLVAFGIPPASPETGYGYIRSAGALGDHRGAAVLGEFVEKPPEDRAREMLAEGSWSWNSGMFLFPPQLLLEELRWLAPEIVHHTAAALALAEQNLDFLRLSATHFAQCPTVSVDHAVMEHTSRAAVVAADFGWDDVGSWSSGSEAVAHRVVGLDDAYGRTAVQTA